jgi:rhodanese-related sulfurtransferase
VKNVLLEAVLVAVTGALLAFAANALSPRGLNLTHNNFPDDSQPQTTGTTALSTGGGTNAASPSPEDLVIARLRQKGLQVVNGTEALELFHDPGMQTGSIIFIDDRKDEEYQAGHIPGAYQFYHYYYEKYLPPILPACQTAQKIVVYCHGGDCTDSESAAIMLRESVHVPNEKLFVYTGGYAEWTAKGWPIENGDRNSGQVKDAGK